MTSKEYVKSIYPTARAEKYTKGKISWSKETYWLIRVGSDTMWLAEGTSERNAWVNAKNKLMEFKYKCDEA